MYNKGAEYGKEIVKFIAVKLTEHYGKGWSLGKLKHCVRSAYIFSEDEIGYAVRIQLTWTHIRLLMSIEDELKRMFYMEMSRIEHWDTRTLDKKIDSMLYERTALAEKKIDLNEVNKQIAETAKKTNAARKKHNKFLKELGLKTI